jgi:hypothetical protein
MPQLILLVGMMLLKLKQLVKRFMMNSYRQRCGKAPLILPVLI